LAACYISSACNGGTRQSSCWIDGALVANGNTNTSNIRQICRPTTSTLAWSDNTDDTGCGTGEVNGAGTCQIVRYLGGAIYAALV